MASEKVQKPTFAFGSKGCRDGFIEMWNEANSDYLLSPLNTLNGVKGFYAFFGRDWYNSLVFEALDRAVGFQRGYQAALDQVAKWIDLEGRSK